MGAKLTPTFMGAHFSLVPGVWLNITIFNASERDLSQDADQNGEKILCGECTSFVRDANLLENS